MQFKLIVPFDCSTLVYRWHRDVDQKRSSWGSYAERVDGHGTRRHVFEFTNKEARDSLNQFLQQFALYGEVVDPVSIVTEE